ncbi:hypothetical protein A6E05_13690 [Aliivibrio sp. 1S165]|uniref:EAL domain-containing response regulator n=1 Tax=unclassified Aliivibrio TaxID=2645654 RepID=UPI00080DE12C|nr:MULTISPECIES: EAL domain-containing response regulator [unclassified Aliivibrio]OCH17339.1 hypothetical protein A6E05_13690 [Aliivibrio sp. 1S165]OCH34333.1 hypothetical protein A6E06_00430 [Aliivibrio sp. 1S175]
MNELKILIIDDDKLQANMLKSLIVEQCGSDAECVYSGSEAIELINKNVFDLIFCDIRMPNMDGVELLIRINNTDFNGGIVIVSALDTSLISIVSDLCHSLQFLLIDALEKPIKNEKIKEIIQTVNEINLEKHDINKAKDIKFSIEDIIEAIDNGEMINYYQPQVDFKTEKIISVETLVRWQHPTYGLLTPYYFLDTCKKQGILDKLFNIVFDNVISDYLSGELKYKVSINITYDSLCKKGFSDEFINKCKENNLDTSLFMLELTEGDAYNSSINFLENISRLRIHKVGVSIDDFGTGHSSLDKLSRLPFTEMKLDRSFITNCLRDRFKQIIIEFSVELAKELNISIVAEGVENKETWEYLKSMDFDICQGFYSGRPISIDMLTDYN